MPIENGRAFPSPKATVTSLGVEHVRLSYYYLDAGDIDGYASLLADEVQVKRTDMPVAHGRAEAERIHRGPFRPRGSHTLYRVFGEAGNIAAVGRFVVTQHERALGRDDTDFVDIFTVTESGLILGQRRFLAPLYLPG